jgi:hypothetical protein
MFLKGPAYGLDGGPEMLLSQQIDTDLCANCHG